MQRSHCRHCIEILKFDVIVVQEEKQTSSGKEKRNPFCIMIPMAKRNFVAQQDESHYAAAYTFSVQVNTIQDNSRCSSSSYHSRLSSLNLKVA